MQLIPIQSIPNQSLSLQIDENFYDLTIKQTRGVVSVTIKINNSITVTSARSVAGEFIIQYPYLQNGNFFISTLNDELPEYNQFGISQQLIYASQSELIA